MKRSLFLLILLLTGIAQAITPWERYSISEAVGQGTWEVSEELFKKLKESELPPEQMAQIDYNLGVALYQQEKYEEALPYFQTAAKTEGGTLKAKALYNQGNTLFRLDRLDEAKAAFQQALLANPDDDDTRHNIEVILEKQEQENQQDKDSDDQDNDSESDQDEQDDKGDSEKQEQDQKNQNDQKNQDSDSEQQDGEDQQDQQGRQAGDQKKDQQEQQQKEMTEEEKQAAQEAAERARLLDYFKQQERDGRPAKRVRPQAPPVRGKTW